jgi:CubicO group peptidase (beta-lactamase class C family)
LADDKAGMYTPPALQESITMTAAPMMRGFPPPSQSQVTLDNWREPPFNVWAYRNIRRLLPTGPISRGSGPVRELERTPQDLAALAYDDGGRGSTIAAMLRETHCDGICVLHRGGIVFEDYANGLTEDGHHIWMSVTKSFVALLIGILAERGMLDPEAPVSETVPEVKGSGYEGATVRHLLDMNADIGFVEDYEDRGGDFARYIATLNPFAAARYEMDPSLWAFVLTLRGGGRHGEALHYVSPNVDLLGWVIERAANEDLSTLISREIWSKIGAESDAYMVLDALCAPRSTGGLNTGLRDMARIGQMVLDRGFANGQQVVPEAWIEDILSAPACEPWRAGEWRDYPPFTGYRSLWYEIDGGRTWAGAGIHGQHLYVDFPTEVVIARFSSQPTAASIPMDDSAYRGYRAICNALAG